MRTEDGRKFCYVCPKCGGDVEGCPDPACSEDGVGHHVDEDIDCDDNVPLKGLEKKYEN